MTTGSFTHVFMDGAIPNTPITVSSVAPFGVRGQVVLGFIRLSLADPGQRPLKFSLMMDLEKNCFVDLPKNKSDRQILKQHAQAIAAVIKARVNAPN